ncbi:hypothetical protein ACIRP0_05300 [Streptomyces sp. NPDC101733]|uniref:hypothetical protein n=1 Tax=unclassified Streptomyces TaxID=2593676 RepID=UPI00380B0356
MRHPVLQLHASGELAHRGTQIGGDGDEQIKTGSLSRSDRTANYNQLIRIEEQLGASAVYGYPTA